MTVVVETNFEIVGCNQIFTKTCTAMDECGNSVTSVVNVYINDTTAPELMGVPADQDVECGDEIPDAFVTAMDNCDDELEIILSGDTEYNDCGDLFTRTWTVADDCGNETSLTQVITIIDTTAPDSSDEPADVVVECSDALPMDDTQAVSQRENSRDLPPTVSNDDQMVLLESSNLEVNFEDQIKNELIQENERFANENQALYAELLEFGYGDDIEIEDV